MAADFRRSCELPAHRGLRGIHVPAGVKMLFQSLIRLTRSGKSRVARNAGYVIGAIAAVVSGVNVIPAVIPVCILFALVAAVAVRRANARGQAQSLLSMIRERSIMLLLAFVVGGIISCRATGVNILDPHLFRREFKFVGALAWLITVYALDRVGMYSPDGVVSGLKVAVLGNAIAVPVALSLPLWFAPLYPFGQPAVEVGVGRSVLLGLFNTHVAAAGFFAVCSVFFYHRWRRRRGVGSAVWFLAPLTMMLLADSRAYMVATAFVIVTTEALEAIRRSPIDRVAARATSTTILGVAAVSLALGIFATNLPRHEATARTAGSVSASREGDVRLERADRRSDTERRMTPWSAPSRAAGGSHLLPSGRHGHSGLSQAIVERGIVFAALLIAAYLGLFEALEALKATGRSWPRMEWVTSRMASTAILAVAVVSLVMGFLSTNLSRLEAAVGIRSSVSASPEGELSLGRTDGWNNAETRLTLWRIAFGDFMRSPILGVGMSRFDDDPRVLATLPESLQIRDIARHGDVRWEGSFPFRFNDGSLVVHSDQHAHNTFLQVLAEGGIVFAALLIAGYLSLIIACARGMRRLSGVAREGVVGGLMGLSVVAIASLLGNNLLGVIPLLTVFILLVPGLSAGSSDGGRSRGEETARA